LVAVWGDKGPQLQLDYSNLMLRSLLFEPRALRSFPLHRSTPTLKQVASAVGASRVFFGRRYEPLMVDTDTRVADALAAAGYEVGGCVKLQSVGL